MSSNYKILLLCAAGLCVTGCAAIPIPDAPVALPEVTQFPPTAAAPYMASGTEPFWSLKIADDRITFQPMEGVATVGDNPTTRPSFNGWRYSTNTVSVDVTFSPCNDGMSDVVYKDTVTVLVGTTEYRGCGGGALTVGTSLANSQWHIVSINGQDIYNPMGRGPLAVNFGKGGFSAATGCNGIGGSFVSGEGWLYAPMMMSTLMACDARLMAQEQAISAALSGYKPIREGSDGTMILGQKGAEITLVRAGPCPDCGELVRDATSPAKPLDGEWDIRHIDGTMVSSDRPYRLSFANGQFSGFAGCNRMFGAYNLSAESVSFSEIGATRMACAGAGGTDEMRVTNILDKPMRYQFVGADMVLLGNAGGGLMLQRVQ